MHVAGMAGRRSACVAHVHGRKRRQAAAGRCKKRRRRGEEAGEQATLFLA